MPGVDNHWVQQYTKFGSYENEVARGNVRGAYPISSYGRLISGSGVTQQLVRDIDGTVLNVPQSVQMSIVSTSANDTAVGTGCRSIIIEYLNGDLDLSYELVTLNGLTPVTTIATDIRWVESVYLATAGSGKVAAGNITVSNGGVSYGRITAGQRQMHSSFYRVPRSKMLYISSVYAGSASGNADSSVIIELATTQINGLDQQETGLFYTFAGIALQDSSTTLSLNAPLPVGSGHIVGFVATSDKGSTMTAGFTGWVE